MLAFGEEKKNRKLIIWFEGRISMVLFLSREVGILVRRAENEVTLNFAPVQRALAQSRLTPTTNDVGFLCSWERYRILRQYSIGNDFVDKAVLC